MSLSRPAALLAAALVLLVPLAVLAPAESALAATLPVRTFTGRAFDTCTAPPLSTMRRWHRHSSYRAIGIYFGGVNRSCSQRHLTAHWVRTVDHMGWRLLPLYAGLQAPCRKGGHRLRRIDPRRALSQGRSQAADALRRAHALGLGKGSPLYLDIENYSRGSARCSRAVIDFAVGWTLGVNKGGYRSGFYSSAGSGIADLNAARRRGRRHLPGTVWYAHWNGHPGTRKAMGLSHHAWHGHRRIHQYRGNVREKHGGAALTVDCSSVDAPVAVVRRYR